MAAPPQPCRPRRTTSSLPALTEELVEEILLRLPPDEPAHLFRAAAVCKAWRRLILSDDGTSGFLRRYREFHRRRRSPLPLLGFFHDDVQWSGACLGFVPVVASAAAIPSLQVPLQHRDGVFRLLDCLHGRVLLEDINLPGFGTDFVVWDPVTDDWHVVPPHGAGSCSTFSPVVLCAATAAGDGDHHHHCRCRRGGCCPFLVVFLGADTAHGTIIRACVYSSEARCWGTPVSSQLDMGCNLEERGVAVIGEEIYFADKSGARILTYDLVKHRISWFTTPLNCREAPVLMRNDDGSLGLATVRDSSQLHLWSRMVSNNREGITTAEWVQRKVIELDRILPIDRPCAQSYVTVFAEGAGILFISTIDGIFTFELQSGRVKMITETMQFDPFFPFFSFFTPCRLRPFTKLACF